LLAIIHHWLTVCLVVGLFVIGIYMVELSYYDPLSRRLPDLHRSIGILLAVVVVFDFVSRLRQVSPGVLSSHSLVELRLAKTVRWILRLLIGLVVISGYLISTAKGASILVFEWFSVPATITFIPDQEDVAGLAHMLLAYLLVFIAAGHAIAAIKHHFIDKDTTLKRMFRFD
jgi:cytochrome b561